MPQPDDATRKQRREAAREARREQERAAAAQATRTRRLQTLGGMILAAAVVIAAVVVLTSGGGKHHPKVTATGPAPNAAVANELLKGIPQHGVVLGNPKAKLTIVEFADLQCPICRQFSATVFPTLLDRYVRPGKAKIVFRNLHFLGPDSLRAADVAAAVAAQNRLWTFVDLFYDNQLEENTGYVTDDFLRGIARGVGGLDVARAFRDRSSPAAQGSVSQADTLGDKLGVTGTPTLFVGRDERHLQEIKYRQISTGQFTGPIDRALGA